MKLKRVLSDYIIEVLKPARADVRRAGVCQENLCAFFGEDRDAETIKRKDGRDYRAKRLRDGVTDSTIRRELGFLMAALRHAAEEERIDAVPAMKLPPEGRPRKRWYTEDEVVKLMEQPMSERARNYIYLALGTGARKTAIVTVKVKKVDLHNGYIDYDDENLPLTRKRRAKVKIADWLLPRVKVMCAGKKADDSVIGSNGPQEVSKEVKRILKAIGIDERGVNCHAFRKTFAMWALINGASMKAVADSLGDTVQTVEKSYTDAFPQNTAAAVNAINNPERTL
jgi:integrase